MSVFGNALVYLHALALCGGGNQRVHETLLQAAFHYVKLLSGNGFLEDGFVQHLKHLHGSEGVLSVHPFVLIHSYQTVVCQQVPEDVVLLVLQQHGRLLLCGAERSLAEREDLGGEGRTEKPFGETEHLVKQELHGFFLAFLFHKDVGLLRRVVLPFDVGTFHVDAANVGHDMVMIEAPLEDDGRIEAGRLVIVLSGLVVLCPFHQIGHHTFEVLDTQACGLDGVVAQVLAQCAGVYGSTLRLCLAVAVFLSFVLFQEGRQHLILVCALRIPAVAPFNGHQVIHSDVGRHHLHVVAGLGHIIEAGIVHDAGRGTTHASGEAFRAQRVCGIGGRGHHVVAQSQRVAHFMASHKTHGISNQLDGELQRTCPGIHRSSLYRNPLADERLHVVPPNDVGLKDFAGAGVNGGGTHGVGLFRGGIGQHGIVHVITFNVQRVIGDNRTHGILEAGTLKGHVPVKYTLDDVGSEMGRHRTANVEVDGLNRFGQLAAHIGCGVLWLQSPSCNVVGMFHLLLFVIVNGRGG